MTPASDQTGAIAVEEVVAAPVAGHPILVITPGPLDPTVADGFRPRYCAFIEALKAAFTVAVCDILPSSACDSQDFVSRVRGRWTLHFSRLPRFSVPLSVDIKEIVRNLAPSLILILSPYLAHVAADIPGGIPIICVLEECMESSPDLEIDGIPRWERSLLRRGGHARARRLYHELAKRCSFVTFIAAEEQAVFLNQVGPEIQCASVVLRHSIDTELYRPQPIQKRFDFVLLGRMGSNRNAVDATAIFDEVTRIAGARNLRWAFVGPEPTDNLRALRGTHVEVPGEVDNPADWISSGRVFLAPGRRTIGVKTTVLQALALGTPVVVHQASTRGLELGNAAIVTRDHRTMAEAAIRLLDDEDRKKSLSLRGIRLVTTNYEIRSRAAELVELCRQTIKASHHGSAGSTP